MSGPFLALDLREAGVFSFVKDDPNGGVYEYDGDNLINYDLSRGHYEPAADGSTLERISATEYRVTRPDRSVYTYQGYMAPWRANQPPASSSPSPTGQATGRALPMTARAASPG